MINAKNSINVGPKYSDYLINVKTFKNFIEENIN